MQPLKLHIVTQIPTVPHKYDYKPYLMIFQVFFWKKLKFFLQTYVNVQYIGFTKGVIHNKMCNLRKKFFSALIGGVNIAKVLKCIQKITGMLQ